MPRAASSFWKPEVYMCSLVLSSPFHMIMHGAGPSPGARVKYAGSVVPSYGTATRVVAGSTSEKASASIDRQRWYVALRSGLWAACMRSALTR